MKAGLTSMPTYLVSNRTRCAVRTKTILQVSNLAATMSFYAGETHDHRARIGCGGIGLLPVLAPELSIWIDAREI